MPALRSAAGGERLARAADDVTEAITASLAALETDKSHQAVLGRTTTAKPEHLVVRPVDVHAPSSLRLLANNRRGFRRLHRLVGLWEKGGTFHQLYIPFLGVVRSRNPILAIAL